VVIVAPIRDNLLRAIPFIKELTICVNLTKAAPSRLLIEVDLIRVSSSRYRFKRTTLSLKIKCFSFRCKGIAPPKKALQLLGEFATDTWFSDIVPVTRSLMMTGSRY